MTTTEDLSRRIERTRKRLELIVEGAQTLANAANETATKAASALSSLDDQVAAGTVTKSTLHRLKNRVYDFVVFAGEPIDVISFDETGDDGSIVYSRLPEVPS